MVANPCPCGLSLRFGSQVVAVLYLARALLILVLGVTFLLLAIVAVAVVSIESEKYYSTNSTGSSRRVKQDNVPSAIPATIIGVAGVGIFVAFSVAGGFSLALAILLWVGITKRKPPLLKTWCFVTAIWGATAAVLIIHELILNSTKFMTSSLVGLLFDAYAVWVVWAYATELRPIQIIQLNNGPTV